MNVLWARAGSPSARRERASTRLKRAS
ncbi:hypothetical protein ACFDR6_27850 [Bradyrhizobium sp. 1AS20L]